MHAVYHDMVNERTILKSSLNLLGTRMSGHTGCDHCLKRAFSVNLVELKHYPWHLDVSTATEHIWLMVQTNFTLSYDNLQTSRSFKRDEAM